MKKFLLFLCIVLIVVLAGLVIVAFVFMPPNSSVNASSTSQQLPPDIAQLIASSSAVSPSSSSPAEPGSASSTIPYSPPASPLSPSNTSTSTSSVTSTPPPVNPQRTILWGAYAGDTPQDGQNFEALVGHQMNMEAVFVGWGDNGPFPSEFGPTLQAASQTLVIFWEPSDGSGSLTEPSYNYASIASGTWDHYIASFATAAQSYGGPIILVPFEEMNGNWDPWDGTVNGNSPASFVAAWIHMHSFFTNTTNVKFAWDPNSTSEPDTAANSIAAYYPGDAYVDYVGTDGFNFDDPPQTFSQIFAPALTQLETYNKPIYIFSMATAEDAQKASWITDALTVQIPNNPIVGWIWFDQNKEQNWLVDSDPASLQAFENALP